MGKDYGRYEQQVRGWLLAAQGKDRHAANEAVSELIRWLKRTAPRKLNLVAYHYGEDEAESVVHDAVLDAIKYYRSPHYASAYLILCLRNKIATLHKYHSHQCRDRSRTVHYDGWAHTLIDAAEYEVRLIDPHDDLRDLLTREELKHVLREAKLSKVERAAIWAHYFKGWGYDEVGRAIDHLTIAQKAQRRRGPNDVDRLKKLTDNACRRGILKIQKQFRLVGGVVAATGYTGPLSRNPR